MLIKGDRIKQIKAIGNFNEIGTVFTIHNISEDGSIAFGCEYGYGIMSGDEFNKYFEKVPVQRVWSEWIYVRDGNYYYKTDGKRIKLHHGEFDVKACCHKDDKFNLNKGLALCLARVEVKRAGRNVTEAIGKLFKAEQNLQNAAGTLSQTA